MSFSILIQNVDVKNSPASLPSTSSIAIAGQPLRKERMVFVRVHRERLCERGQHTFTCREKEIESPCLFSRLDFFLVTNSLAGRTIGGGKRQ